MGDATPYDHIAIDFAGARVTLRTNEARYLDLVLSPLTAPGTVLDLGCGNGHPIASHIAALGHRIVGVDESTAMLTIAREGLPEHRWIHSAMEALELGDSDSVFDAVICWDALFHVPRERWPRTIEKVHTWLRPGGRFMVSSGGVVDETGNGFTDTMFGHAFFYDSLAPDNMTALLERTGFTIVLAEMCDVPDGGRNKGKWATIAERNA